MDCPGDVGGAAIQLAVNKIGATPEEQSDWRGDTEVIARIGPRQFMPARINEGEDDDADEEEDEEEMAAPESAVAVPELRSSPTNTHKQETLDITS